MTLFAAVGLGRVLSNRFLPLRVAGWIAALALAALAAQGDRALIRQSDGLIGDLERLTAQADLVVIVPRLAQSPVHAMLTGDAPIGSATARWPPVCPSAPSGGAGAPVG